MVNGVFTHTEFELLVKYLAGEATPEEAMRIDELLQNDANRQEYHQLQILWLLFETERYQTVYPDQVWPILQPEHFKKANRIAFKKNWLYAAAASFIGLIFLVSIAYRLNNRRSEVLQTIVLKTDVSKKITLSDGSTVFLKPNSTVAYNTDFNKKKRELKFQGEAFFSVAHDRQRPFVIKVGDTREIEVLGTVFNVKTLENDELEVQVQTGLVKLNDKSGFQLIRANQSGIFHKNGQVTLHDSININALTYATGRFALANSPFIRFAAEVENAFGVEIENKYLYRECVVTMDLQGASLPEILQKVCEQLNLTYTMKKSKVLFSGISCAEINKKIEEQYQFVQLWEVTQPFTTKEKEIIANIKKRGQKNISFYELSWNSIEGLNRFLSKNSMALTAKILPDGRLTFQGKGALYFFGPLSRSIVIICKNGTPCFFGTGNNLNKLSEVLNLHN